MESIKKNFLYNSIYQILLSIVPLITTPYISRVLGSEGIGRYSFAYSVSFYFVMFVMLGLNNYGNRTIAMVRDDIEQRSKTFLSIYYMQVLLAVIITLLYFLYAFIISDDTLMSLILALFVVSAGFDVNWFFFGMEKFKITVTRNTVIKLLTVLAIFTFVNTKNDVYKYAFIYSAGTIMGQIFLWIQIKKYVVKVKVSIKDICAHIKPNLILFIPVIAVSLYKYMDKIMLGSMTTKIEVGYYESCDKVLNVPIGLINSLGIVMLPRISNMLANKKTEDSISYLGKSILFAMFLATSVSFGIMAVSREFVPLFYGRGFEKCVLLYIILLPTCIFCAQANVIRTQYLIPNKKDKEYINAVFGGAIVNLVVNYFLIPIYGSVGAAVGTFCAESVVCLIQFVLVRKELPIMDYVRNSIPFILAGAMMFLVDYNLNFGEGVISLMIKVVIGAIVYFVCLTPLVLLVPDIKEILIPFLKKG